MTIISEILQGGSNYIDLTYFDSGIYNLVLQDNVGVIISKKKIIKQ
ncbi:MAG: hypothetical protein ACI86P_000917 [Flavobacteriales bacterium]|jgi:hypothetical protein